MKNDVKNSRRRNYMRVLIMLLLLVSPFVAQAQVDDIYFVPKKKSEKTLVVESVAEKYNVSNSAKSAARDVDEYNRRAGGFTDDPEAYIEENYADEYDAAEGGEYQDFDYSTRIIRFHSPTRAVSSLYWDLTYDCGVSDWYVYDNGYSIDIYPTANNPLYYWGGSVFYWNSLNFHNWRSWYNWGAWNYVPYWGWNYYGHHHHYHGHHDYWHDYYMYNHYLYNNHYWHNHAHLGGDKFYDKRNRRRHIPHNGAVTNRRDVATKSVSTNASAKEKGQVSGGTARRGNANSGTVDLRGVKNGSKRGENNAVTTNRTNENNNGSVNLRGKSGKSGSSDVRRNDLRKDGRNSGATSGVRRQQPSRGSVNSSGDRKNSSVSGSGSTTRQRNSSATKNSGSTVNRRSSSSGSYNRQSSTSVSRSRSSSGSSRGSSTSYGRSSGGSLRSSGASSGSGSRSGGSSSSGSTSRSSGGRSR